MKIYCHTRETVMKIRLRSSNIIRWKTVYIYYLNTTESCVTWCKLCTRTTAELIWCENQNQYDRVETYTNDCAIFIHIQSKVIYDMVGTSVQQNKKMENCTQITAP